MFVALLFNTHLNTILNLGRVSNPKYKNISMWISDWNNITFFLEQVTCHKPEEERSLKGHEDFLGRCLITSNIFTFLYIKSSSFKKLWHHFSNCVFYRILRKWDGPLQDHKSALEETLSSALQIPVHHQILDTGQAFSTLVLLTFRARSVFAVGLSCAL